MFWFSMILNRQVCAQKCVANSKCTHYTVIGCTLIQSSTCLNIKYGVFQNCGYVPDRTCPKQATTVDDKTKRISVCQWIQVWYTCNNVVQIVFIRLLMIEINSRPFGQLEHINFIFTFIFACWLNDIQN